MHAFIMHMLVIVRSCVRAFRSSHAYPLSPLRRDAFSTSHQKAQACMNVKTMYQV